MPVQDASRLHEHHDDVPTATPRSATVALCVLCLCALTTGLDITITNVALPFISKELDAGTNGLQWVIDAYTLALAGLLVLGGGLGDRWGRKKVFLVGYTIFGFGCLLAAFSPSTEALIAARTVMGIGAAGVISPALAILAGVYPPERRAKAIAAWAVFGAAGLAIGPVVGGFLLDAFWWGSVFLVNVPFVAVGVVVGIFVLPESKEPEHGPLDVRGAVLSIVSLALILFAVIEGPDRGWISPAVTGAAVLGVVTLALFVRIELRSDAPIFDVRVLRRPIVAAGAITLFVTYAVFNGMLFLVPQYLQDVEGVSIVDVGLLLVPFAASFGVLSMQASRAVDAWGERRAVSLGLLGCTVGCVALIPALDVGVWAVVAGTVVLGSSMSLLIAPASTVVMNDLPPEKAGEGSSLNMVSRFVGGALFVGIIGSLLAEVYGPRVEQAPGFEHLNSASQEAVHGSISGAAEVAPKIGANGATLLDIAGEAYIRGAQAGFLLLALVSLAAATWAWKAIPRR
jgi:DHA2 family multidrug resistance protein-like MFS transporter